MGERNAVDRYRRLRKLGEGGAGQVWLVEDLRRSRSPIAIKELPEASRGTEDALRREFATLSSLRHPNLAEVYDLDTSPHDGLPRFTLEYIDGPDLVGAARRESPTILIQLFAEALRAVSFLHDFGFIHRDLKPQNLLVRNQPRNGARVVVLDFGLALRGDGPREEVRPAGTLPYMAPELFSGSPADRRSDLYAIGAVAFEAVHGRVPVPADPADLRSFVESARAGERPHVDLPAGFPSGLGHWLGELISVDPTRRPVSASEAIARLNAACGTAHPIELPDTRLARLGSGKPPGRDGELGALEGLLALDDPCRLIWLTGEAGAGKTRVLRWLTTQAIRDGWEVVSEPLLAEPVGGSSAEDAREHLRALASHRPTLALFDEVESAGPAVNLFLESLVDQATVPQLKVAAAIRPVEVVKGAVSRMVDAAGLVPGIARVDLPPMNLDGVKRLCERVTGGRSYSVEQAQWLLDSTEGNPLAIESMLVNDVWAQGGTAPRHRTLEESVLARVDALDEQAESWLQALVVLGRDSTQAFIDSLAGLTESQGRRAGDECARLNLASSHGERWKAASQLIASCVLEHLPETRSIALHRRAAELICESGEASEAPRLARLYRVARDPANSVARSIQAAESAGAEGRHDDASFWYRFAIVQLGRADERRRDLRARQSIELLKSDQPLRAGRAYLATARLAPRPAERAEYVARAAHAMARARQFKLSMRLAQRAKELAVPVQAKHAIAIAESAIGFTEALSGKREEAIRTMARAANALAEVGDVAGQAEAVHVTAVCESALRRYGAARRGFEVALPLARSVGDFGLEANILIGLGATCRREWLLDDALRFCGQARKVCQRHGLKSQHLSVLSYEALILFELGRYAQCIDMTREMEPIALHLGLRNMRLMAILIRANALLYTGRPAEATALAEQTLQGSREGVERNFEDFLKMTVAESLLEGPNPADSRIKQLLDELLRSADSDPKVLHGALVVEMERRILPASADPIAPIWSRYAALFEADPEAIEPPIQIRAELARSRALLDENDAKGATKHAESAASLAEEKDIPHLGARAYALLAEAQDAQGLREEAIASITQGRALLEAAAERIEDVELRRDFLDREVFRDLRRSRFTAEAAIEDRLMAIYDMIRALNSETDPDALLESMLDMALRVVRAERGMILLAEEGGSHSVHLARNLEQETIRDAVEFSRTAVLEAGAGKAVLALDAEGDQRLSELKSVSMFGIRSILCVPLRCRARIIGAVYLDSRTQGTVFDNDDLRFLEAFADHAALALENARSRRSLEQRNRRLQAVAEGRSGLGELRGRSSVMQRVYDLILKFADSNLPALIQGESGTGKELVARAIHAQGPRKRKIFLSENCAAIPETLLESELFGHVKGAFTGADRDRAGLFEQADGGTLFLDEVGEMSPAMQARLLRVLQEGEVRRVGADGPLRVDVRLLAATNRQLQHEVDEGRFREDLFYRLQVLVLELPPLRERAGDVPLLVDHFLARIRGERRRAAPTLHAAVVDLLERYAWPGNVRQLENVLQRLALLAGDGPVTLEVAGSDRGLRDTLFSGAAPAEPAYSLERNERERIREALEAAAGNRARAARILGISRATIFRKIKEYRLS